VALEAKGQQLDGDAAQSSPGLVERQQRCFPFRVGDAAPQLKLRRGQPSCERAARVQGARMGQFLVRLWADQRPMGGVDQAITAPSRSGFYDP